MERLMVLLLREKLRLLKLVPEWLTLTHTRWGTGWWWAEPTRAQRDTPHCTDTFLNNICLIVSGPLFHGPPLTAMASPFLLELFVFALYSLRLPFVMGLFQIYEWSSR